MHEADTLPGILAAMDILLFALFFTAVAIGFLLVFMRTAKTLTLLQELLRLRALEDRLKAIEQGLQTLRSQLPVTAVQESLETLHGIHDRIGQLGELSAAKVVEIPAQPRAEARPADTLRELVENRLFGMGYRQVRILSDLPDRAGPDELTVRVECQREDVVFKGQILVKNGAVLDVRLSSVLQMFP